MIKLILKIIILLNLFIDFFIYAKQPKMTFIMETGDNLCKDLV